MSEEQGDICNEKQMVTTGDRAELRAGSQLEISMTFIFIFPYVVVSIAVNEIQIEGWCFLGCNFLILQEPGVLMGQLSTH